MRYCSRCRVTGGICGNPPVTSTEGNDMDALLAALADALELSTAEAAAMLREVAE